MLGPRTLAKAIGLTKIQEQTLIVQKQVFIQNPVLPTPKTGPKYPYSNLPAPAYTKPNVPLKQPNPPGGSSKPNYRPPRLLSPAEMEDKRSKGLCFNCDEKYSYGHVCKKKRQLFCLEVEEPEELTEEVDTGTELLNS